MRIDGTHRFDAPREEVWDLLRDPETVKRLLPGVERLDATSDREYEGKLKVGSGWLKATYDVTVRVVDERAPERLELAIEGNGRLGDAGGTLAMDLEDAGDAGTDLRYQAVMEIGGPAGAMAGSFEGVADRKVRDGLARLDRVLERRSGD